MPAGPIGLLGGLEHYPVTESFDRHLLDEVGARSPLVIVLPFASLPWQAVAAGELARSHWTRLGAKSGCYSANAQFRTWPPSRRYGTPM
jgi:hypothetical protein